MLKRAGIAAIALLMLSTSGVAAATKTVEIHNFFFKPATVTIGIKGKVNWHNVTASTTHTATSDVLPLFDATIGAGQTSPGIGIGTSGTYPYHCKIHPDMHGKIAVRMNAVPSTGPLGTFFLITWAQGDARSGWVYDVQKRKAGGTFKNWLTGVAQASAFFDAPSKGTFEFRMRLRKTNSPNAGASLYSPVLQISVT